MPGRYVVGHPISFGSQSEVFYCYDRLSRNQCVLKIGSSVKKEGLLSRELNHPYIVKPFDLGTSDELGTYAAYPLAAGPSLAEWKSRVNDFRTPALQIAEFLSFLHHSGWVYNDFKPEHFRIEEDGLTVLDLGLCSPLHNHHLDSVKTYSGTFPFISPERLSGRAADLRSDLFALGILFHYLLFPESSIPHEPSLEVLRTIQKKSQQSNGFWGNVIRRLTAWEPSQRMSSAEELWNLLLPNAARKSFLFFPVNRLGESSIPLFAKERVVLVQSPSVITADNIENETVLQAWKQGLQTVIYDLRLTSVEQSLLSLCEYFCDQVPTNVYSAIQLLKQTNDSREFLIIFRHCDSLNRKDRSLLAFCLSVLSHLSFLRFLLTSNTAWGQAIDENWKFIDSASEFGFRTEEILSKVFPDGSSGRGQRVLKGKMFKEPEQMLIALRSELSPEGMSFWPSAARGVSVPGNYQTLSVFERRLLSAVTLAGGSIRRKRLETLCRTGGSLQHALERLLISGYLKRIGDLFILSNANSNVLNSLRIEQIKKLSNTLLSGWAHGEDLESLYRVASQAKEMRTACVAALRLWRTSERMLDSERMNWLWNAFVSGARIPKTLLYRLARFFLKCAYMSRTEKIIRQIRSRYGMTFRLANLYLDLYQNIFRMDLASKLAETAFKVAVRWKRKDMANYFRLKQAGFYVHESRLDESEGLLSEFSDRLFELHPKLQGLFHHFNGLLNFHRGFLEQANISFKNAIKNHHPLARVSLMNLGIAYGRMGEFQKGEDSLRKAIRLFTKVQDSDSLAYAYCNLGILLKQKGQLLEARKNLHRSMNLSSNTENRKTAVMSMIGLANTFTLEGRPDMYLLYYKKAYKLSAKARLPIWAAYSLNNAGLQYAIQGKLRLACRLLNRAIKIRTDLRLQSDIAASLENLGLAHFFSHNYAKSIEYLQRSEQQFVRLGLLKDAVRTRLYKVIGKIQKGIPLEAKKLFDEIPIPESNSFERGLWHYVDSCFQLNAKQFDRLACRESIHEAELVFRKLSDLIWLGKTFDLKSRYYGRTEQYEKACSTADMASEIFSRIGAQREVLQVQKGVAKMKMPDNFMVSVTERLPFRVLQIVRDVLSERDPASMIKKILCAVLDLTDMERAVLILNEDPPRIFASKTVMEEELKEIQKISMSALQSASGKSPFICTNVTSEPSLSQRPSILSNQIMSVVCLPLQTHDEIVGFLYLDSREGIETVASIEKTLLEIFSSVIALALDTTMLLNQSIQENENFKTSLGLKDQFPQIIGTGKAMHDILEMVRRLLSSDLPVLITGETGTGKELIARLLHYCGGRKSGPFVAINCSALTESILESELFGHEKGSFTGASNMRRGLFEEAQHGTLFLDEIGDMPLSVQAKFLRVLQDGEFRRVGGNRTLYTNARIILATNRNLEELVNNRLFREDLYYRIRVARLNVPPLRERKEDIPMLASYFLKSAADTAHRKIRGFSPEALDLIKQYPWPGNVRQLKNEIERIVALTENDRVYPSDFDPQAFYSGQKMNEVSRNEGTLREMEKSLILDRLKSHNWNILHAAKSLGLTRNGLYSKMRIFEIRRTPA